MPSPGLSASTAMCTTAPTAVHNASLSPNLVDNTENGTTGDLFFLVTLFLKRLRPSMPFFESSYLLDNLKAGRQTHDRAFDALLHAIGALALFQPMLGSDQALIPDRVRRGNALLEKAVHLHSHPDLGQNPVLENVLSSVFLFACQFCRGNHNAARFRLQEAIRLCETMHLHIPQDYGHMPVDERDRRLRTVLCLTVIEKYGLPACQKAHVGLCSSYH